jgi:hypothetical protein
VRFKAGARDVQDAIGDAFGLVTKGLTVATDLASLSDDLHDGASVTAALAGFGVRLGFDFGGPKVGAAVGGFVGEGVLDVGTIPVGAFLGDLVAGAEKNNAAKRIERFIDQDFKKMTMSNIVYVGVFLASISFLLFNFYQGIRYGHLWGGFSEIYRRENPVYFWFMLAVYGCGGTIPTSMVILTFIL